MISLDVLHRDSVDRGNKTLSYFTFLELKELGEVWKSCSSLRVRLGMMLGEGRMEKEKPSGFPKYFVSVMKLDRFRLEGKVYVF